MQRESKSTRKRRRADSVDYLVIGGGVAGTTAAQVLRQRDQAASIAIVSDEPHRFYSRIMLSQPNFFLGKIPLVQIWLKIPSWYGQQRIELVAGAAAVGLDAGAKIVTLADGRTFRYGKLLIATGAQAMQWQVPGADKRGVLYLRTLDDARAIMDAIQRVQRAVCVGSGFTSLEMCEMLAMAGVSVTLVMREPHYWDPLLDEASGKIIEAAMQRGGVKIYRNSLIKTVDGNGKVTGVTLEDGRQLPCELIIAGVGALPHVDWLQAAGVAVNRGVITDEYLATNVPDVFAAGDCAEFRDLILEEQVILGNWVNAQMHGNIAALNMLGEQRPFTMVSFYTAMGFGLTIAFAGDVRHQGRRVIARGSPEAGRFARLIVDDHDELVGATFINRTNELQPVCRLIERNVKVSTIEKSLRDSAVDLQTIPV